MVEKKTRSTSSPNVNTTQTHNKIALTVSGVKARIPGAVLGYLGRDEVEAEERGPRFKKRKQGGEEHGDEENETTMKEKADAGGLLVLLQRRGDHRPRGPGGEAPGPVARPPRAAGRR